MISGIILDRLSGSCHDVGDALFLSRYVRILKLPTLMSSPTPPSSSARAAGPQPRLPAATIATTTSTAHLRQISAIFSPYSSARTSHRGRERGRGIRWGDRVPGIMREACGAESRPRQRRRTLPHRATADMSEATVATVRAARRRRRHRGPASGPRPVAPPPPGPPSGPAPPAERSGATRRTAALACPDPRKKVRSTSRGPSARPSPPRSAAPASSPATAPVSDFSLRARAGAAARAPSPTPGHARAHARFPPP